jgi:hypothetical protein
MMNITIVVKQSRKMYGRNQNAAILAAFFKTTSQTLPQMTVCNGCFNQLESFF